MRPNTEEYIGQIVSSLSGPLSDTRISSHKAPRLEPFPRPAATLHLIWHHVRLAVLPRQQGIRRFVVVERLAVRVELQLAADPVGDVRRVAQGRWQATLLDLAIQVLALARAHALEKVLQVTHVRQVEIRDLRSRQVGNKRDKTVKA